MKNIQREDIHIIARHSNLTEKEITTMLKENVYNDKKSWQNFFKLFFATLGVGFTVSGIIFFFAYNWADLNRFAKIGIVEGLIILATGIVLLIKMSNNLRNIILTGTAVLVGVLFAVFGQIYQTGANAYDFFLAWTVFVTLWAVAANFAPLWLLYLILINTTLILYAQQVAKDWSIVFVFTLLFIINAVILIVSIIKAKEKLPDWFRNTLALAVAAYATIGIIIGIADRYMSPLPVLTLMTAGLFALGIWYGLKSKNGFYLAVIALCIIIIISTLLVRAADGEAMLLFLSLFIISSVTLTIKTLIDLQKKWTNEK